MIYSISVNKILKANLASLMHQNWIKFSTKLLLNIKQIEIRKLEFLPPLFLYKHSTFYWMKFPTPMWKSILSHLEQDCYDWSMKAKHAWSYFETLLSLHILRAIYSMEHLKRWSKMFFRLLHSSTAHKKSSFFIKDFFRCDQIRRKLRIWSHLLKKSLMETFIGVPISGSQLAICDQFRWLASGLFLFPKIANG